MAKKTLKSAAGAAEEQLKAGAKKLQEQLVTVEKAAEKLATKAKERLPAATDVTAKAKAAVAKRGSRGKGSRPTPVMAPPGASPDDSWTVADLRAEAKRRRLTGYSRMTKAELLALLRG
jgi:hypothetical protein